MSKLFQSLSLSIETWATTNVTDTIDEIVKGNQSKALKEAKIKIITSKNPSAFRQNILEYGLKALEESGS